MAPPHLASWLSCAPTVTVIGDAGVGKTSLLRRATSGEFTGTYVTTVGLDFRMAGVDVIPAAAAGRTSRAPAGGGSAEPVHCKLRIWDTAGQERFHTITTAYLRNAQGIMLCYDVTNLQSFLNVRHWMQEIEQHAPYNRHVVMLVACKSDMATRVVEPHMGVDLADEYGMAWFETSSKTGLHVVSCFETLAELVYHAGVAGMTRGVSGEVSGPIRLASSEGLRPANPCCGGGV